MEYEKEPEVVLSVFDTPKQNSFIVRQRQRMGSSFSVSLPNNKPMNEIFFVLFCFGICCTQYFKQLDNA